MRKNKRSGYLFLTIFILLALLSGLSGCASSHEPEEVAYVLALGIDHGSSNLRRVTYLIATPRQTPTGIEGTGGAGGGGGGGNEDKTFMTTPVEAPSIYASLNLINSFVGRRVSLMHTKILVFSEAMARDGSLAEVIPALLQFREIRGTTVMAISKDPPEKALENMNTPFTGNPSKFIELMEGSTIFTGLAPFTTLRDFYNFMKIEGVNNVCSLISLSKNELPPQEGQGSYKSEGDHRAGELVKEGGSAIEALGAAAFDGTHMVGELTGDENVFYSMITGEFKTGFFSFEDPLNPRNPISIQIFESRRPRIKVDITPDETFIYAKILLDGNILGNPSLIDYAMPEKRRALEQHLSDYMKKRMEALVRRTQEEFKSDILRFGLAARKSTLTMAQWLDVNWAERYPEATVQIDVNFKIRRTGLNYRVLPAVDPQKGIREGENPR